ATPVSRAPLARTSFSTLATPRAATARFAANWPASACPPRPDPTRDVRYAVCMPDPRLPDYTHLVPTSAPPDREVDLTHVAHVERPAPESVLHLGKGPAET